MEEIIAKLQAGAPLPNSDAEWEQVVDPEMWVAPPEVTGENAKDQPIRVVRRLPNEMVRTRKSG